MAGSNPFLKALWRVVRDVTNAALKSSTRSTTRKQTPKPGANLRSQPTATSEYPGDFQGRPKIVYSPHQDGEPDPGEIVWTWVPFEEDYSQGKDRPVLLIGRDRGWLLGLQVTSKDHDRDAQQEARAGRYWMDIGTGAWDSQRRPSEVRVNRVLRIDADKVRRIGAILDKRTFQAVASDVARHY